MVPTQILPPHAHSTQTQIDIKIKNAMMMLTMAWVPLALLALFGHIANAFGPSLTSRVTQTHRLQGRIPAVPRTQLFATNREYDDLIQWFLSSNEKSYISPKVKIQPSTRGGLATGGYGAFVNGDIPEGELLLRIPMNCCVTLDDALNDIECGPAFQKLMEKAGPGSDTVIIAGYLAKEYLLLKEYDRRLKAGEKADDNSEMRRLSKIKFMPYLRTLPWGRGVNAQEHVLFWEDGDVDSLLKGSLAYADAVETRSTVKLATKILNEVIGPVIRKARGDEDEAEEKVGLSLKIGQKEFAFRWDEQTVQFPWQSQEEEKPSGEVEILDGLDEAVRGAFVICLSRSFGAPSNAIDGKEGDAPSNASDGNQEDRLEPFLDMLQHSNTPNVKHKCVDDGSIEVTAGTDLKSGEELFNQYRGEEDINMPYHKFFTRFGFVPGVTEPVANLIAERSTIFFPQRATV